MMNEEQFQQLLDKYRQGRCTEAEKAQLESWITFGAFDGRVVTDADIEANLRKLDRRLPLQTPMRKVAYWMRYAAAATVILVVSAWWIFLLDRPVVEEDQLELIGDIMPGGNRATLTLADGRMLELSESHEGIIINEGEILYQDGTDIFNAKQQIFDHRLADVERSLGSNSSNLLSITTPKGGTYRVTLPDGSKVWLNAGSTLKYPSRFDGDERVVELEGEAFFEIKEQRIKEQRQQTRKSLGSGVSDLLSYLPFRVVTAGQTVEVLGTEFNISAYADEPETKTTLVAGSVRVEVSPSKGNSGDRKVLLPNTQSVLHGTDLRVKEIDVRNYISWKDGIFMLDQADLITVIRQIERWYDVTFERNGLPTQTKLNGILHRDAKLSAILEVLSLNTGKTFQVKGRRVMIE